MAIGITARFVVRHDLAEEEAVQARKLSNWFDDYEWKFLAGKITEVRSTCLFCG